MHRLTLLSVGKIKTSWIREGCEEFISRLDRMCDFDERILSAGSIDEEHQKILKATEGIDGVIVALDEKGKEFTSQKFADFIGTHRDTGTPITFILGGAYGLNDAIRAKSKFVISLSQMTYPHELCKLIFTEQLYRAHAILSGSGYHHS